VLKLSNLKVPDLFERLRLSSLTNRIMSWTRKPWPKSDVGLLATSTLLCQCFTAAVCVLLTRCYTPEEFGLFELFFSAVSVLTIIAAARYEVAIPIANDESSAHSLLALVFSVTAGTSLLLACLLVMIPDSIFTRLPSGSSSFLQFLPLGMLCAAVFQGLTFWATRCKSFRSLAIGKAFQCLGILATQLTAGMLGAGAEGLIYGMLVGYCVGGGWLASSTLDWSSKTARDLSAASLIAAAHRFKRFPLIATWGALINTLGLRLPTVIIAYYYSLEIAGLYALASRVLALPLTIIGRSVLQVCLGEGAALVREEPESLREYFVQTLKRQVLWASAIPIASLPAPFVFRFVFGSSWEMAGNFAQILSIACALQFLSAPLTACIDLTERQDLHLLRELIRLALLGAGILLIVELQTSAIQAATILSCVSSLACLCSLGISLYALHAWQESHRHTKSSSSPKLSVDRAA